MALAAPLRLTPSFPFVGRTAELGTLRALLPDAESDGRRVALLGGEPGSGKSRLVRELAGEAASGGVLVLYGSSDAVVNTAYQPFVEALDVFLRETDPDVLRDCLGTGGGELTRLLPELPLRVGPLPAPVAADPDTERHRLHAAVADLLAAVGRLQPVLVVVEDAHWADAPTLHLFRHLARTSADARLLLLATYRDPESDVRPVFSEALADLSRTEGVVRVRLGGLSVDEVAELVRRSAGVGPDTDLSALPGALWDLTGGNPFLLCELWRSLVESSTVEIADGTVVLARPIADLGSPESVRDVVGHRLGRLAASTTALLEVAAVIGRDFELAVLGAAAGLDEPALATALEESVRSGMIEEVPGPGLVHRFTHELVRVALYDGLAGVRRAELHLRVGEALERSDRTARFLPELAHHFSLAAPIAGADRAIEYNVRAARSALDSLAFEDAAARLTTALELGIDDEDRRAHVQLELGAAHHKAGQTLDALDAFRSAAELARGRGDAELLARAAIGFEEACWAPGITEGAVELLRETTVALGDHDSALRARALAALSRELVLVGEHDGASDVRAQAISIARRLGDPQTLANVLIHAYWARATVPLEDVLALLTEAKQIGVELGDAEVQAQALAWRVVTLVGVGDLDAARRELGALLRVAEQTRQPIWLHIADLFGSALALCDGQLADAYAAAERSWSWRSVLRGRDVGGYGIQLFGIRREQDRLAELGPVLELLATQSEDDGVCAWRPGLVALLAEIGVEEKARSELTLLRAGGFAAIPRDSLWMASLVYLTDATSALDDRESAALLYPELEHFGGGVVQIGQLVACYGAADRYLGMLAAVLGKWDVAEAHFEYALYLNRRMGAHTWTAHTCYELARMLLRRDQPGDGKRAAELLAEAGRASVRMGLQALGRKVRTLTESDSAAAAYPDGLSLREVEVLRLVARGRSNREIGGELYISEHTAANHVRSILRKTSTANRTDAASYAHRHGLVET